MPVGIATTTIGAATAAYGSRQARKSGEAAVEASGREAELLDRRERETFEEAMRQAEQHRKLGKAALAESYEQGAIAEAGAEKLDRWAKRAIEESRTGAKRIEDTALRVYQKIQGGAKRREAAGLDAASAIRESVADLTGATERSAAGQRDAFGNIQDRFQPFMTSEAAARGQMDIELGLAPGEGQRTYRDTPAYMEAQRASRQLEEDAQRTMSQDEANQGGLYSGRRGEAMMDISREGSWQRAGVEQNYYNNYMNLLQGMSNPNAMTQVSGYEMDTARNIGAEGISAAGTGLNAEQVAQGMTLDTMRTGGEGQNLMQFMRRGDEGAEYIPYLDQGTAGIPYRMTGLDYAMNADANAGAMITGASPTGYAGAQTRLGGTAAANAARADVAGGWMDFGGNLMEYGIPNGTTPGPDPVTPQPNFVMQSSENRFPPRSPYIPSQTAMLPSDPRATSSSNLQLMPGVTTSSLLPSSLLRR